MKRHAAPIIVAVLLLVTALYVGSYFALVVPRGRLIWPTFGCSPYECHYRLDSEFFSAIFWPMEKTDRKLRPDAWEPLITGSGGGDRRRQQ